MLFLTISEGKAGDETEPIIATSDPAIIRAVIGALERRVAPGLKSVRTISELDPGAPSA
jgi:hypothetical protein